MGKPSLEKFTDAYVVLNEIDRVVAYISLKPVKDANDVQDSIFTANALNCGLRTEIDRTDVKYIRQLLVECQTNNTKSYF